MLDIFYRVRLGDAQIAGTGLGQSIYQGILEARGSEVRIESRVSGTGAATVLAFPASAAGMTAQMKKDAAYG